MIVVCKLTIGLCILTVDFIHLLTPWSRVLLEKLTDFQLVKKFPAFYGTRRFITAVTSARHLYLSWASSIQSTPPHPTSRRPILILSAHLRLGLPSGLFPSGSPQTLYTPLLSPIRATCPAHLILLDLITRTILGEEYRSLSCSLCSFLYSSVTSSLLGLIFSSTLYFQTHTAYVSPSMWATKFHTHTKKQATLYIYLVKTCCGEINCNHILALTKLVLALYPHRVYRNRFYMRSYSSEKRLLASSCPSVCLSVRRHLSARLPRISVKFNVEDF